MRAFTTYHQMKSSVTHQSTSSITHHSTSSVTHHSTSSVTLSDETHQNEEHIKEILMSIPDYYDNAHYNQHQRKHHRESHNVSEIAQWNNVNFNLLKNINQKHLTIKKQKRQRKAQSQNGYFENVVSNLTIASTPKRDIHKKNFPLKEKIINSQQFNRISQHYKEKNTKTREEIKLDIIKSKHEIVPVYLSHKKKAQRPFNFEKIIKMKSENSNYHKIRRRNLYTIDLQKQNQPEPGIENMCRTKQKSFFLHSIKQGHRLPFSNQLERPFSFNI